MLAAKFQAIFPHLDERQRRLLMGAEARALGHGGIRLVAQAAGVREATVSLGVFPVTEDEDVEVIDGEDVRAWFGPAGWVLAGPWCACWRGGGQSVVISVIAARAPFSSTMDLRFAQAATRAWVAMLLTARGRPRAASWIKVTASSLNSGSDRPASLR